jgi:hypothetical protein
VFEKFDIPKSVPVITWLRDPVERVISNYFYLYKVIQERMTATGHFGNDAKSLIKTIEEYAATEVNRNRMSKFLSGASLEDFFFIGIMENYESDLSKLANLLKWKDYQVFNHNKTMKQKPEVPQETRDFIKSLNEKDVDIYASALALKD